MCSMVKMIKASSKLPGFLFVLAITTNINDTIYVCCDKNDFMINKTLLKSIGLYAEQFIKPNEITEYNAKTLFILNNPFELNSIIPERNISFANISFIHLLNINSYKSLIKEANRLIEQYPNCIITADISRSTKENEFYIAIKSTNSLLEKLKKHITISD